MTPAQASALRAFARVAIACATAFGLKLSPTQIVAVQAVAEAAINLPVQWRAAKAKDGGS